MGAEEQYRRAALPRWTLTSEELPPFYERVLIKTFSSNLVDWNKRFIYVFLADRRPAQVEGNNETPYRWRAENGASWWGQEVKAWMRVPE